MLKHVKFHLKIFKWNLTCLSTIRILCTSTGCSTMETLRVAQCNTRLMSPWIDWKCAQSILRRWYLPESRIESAYNHSKLPALSTNESDQTISKRTEFSMAELYPFQVIWADQYMQRRGRIPVHAGSDMWVLALDRTFPTKITTHWES